MGEVSQSWPAGSTELPAQYYLGTYGVDEADFNTDILSSPSQLTFRTSESKLLTMADAMTQTIHRDPALLCVLFSTRTSRN